MKKNRSVLVPVGGVIILAVLTLVLNSFPVRAAEVCAVITVNGPSGVTPSILDISKGDCVVWMNWTRHKDVSVVFKEGTKCIEGTKAPVQFKFEKTTGCFVAQKLSYGETASFVFNNPGKYDYEILFEEGGKVNCSITVKE
jgi:hypothetical protein